MLESCVVGVPTRSDSFPNITLRFREDLLMDDAVMVNDPLMQALQLADPISGWMGGGIAADAAGLVASLGTGSPLQIEPVKINLLTYNILGKAALLPSLYADLRSILMYFIAFKG